MHEKDIGKSADVTLDLFYAYHIKMKANNNGILTVKENSYFIPEEAIRTLKQPLIMLSDYKEDRKTIGITGRPFSTDDKFQGENGLRISKVISDLLESYGYNVMALVNSIENANKDKELMYEQLSNCDAVMSPGGSAIKHFIFDVVDYCCENNMPYLGICMGMQALAIRTKQNKTNDSSNMLVRLPQEQIELHSKPTILDQLVHPIIIKENSKLFEIYNNFEIMVNSNHRMAIKGVEGILDITALYPVNMTLKEITAFQRDGILPSDSDKYIIEGIQSKENPNMVGFGFHPEYFSRDFEVATQKVYK